MKLKVSKVTGGVIRHLLQDQCLRIFKELCLDSADGLVIALLGPSQCGKSLILDEVVAALHSAFLDHSPGAIPVVCLQIESVSDGRVKPKWICIELLKALAHPIYKHIGELDEAEFYMPSKGRDEGTLRIALKSALMARRTRRTVLDEFHLLTQTKDPTLRASILESIKSTCAIDRTLVVGAGYEAAYNGIFDSPHFAGRLIFYDFGNYREDNPEHVEAWLKILKTFSEHLDIDSKNLLLNEWKYSIRSTNGVFGILDKSLWLAKVKSKILGKPISKEMLRSCMPAETERKLTAMDIAEGRKALERLDVLRAKAPEKSEGSAQKAGSKKPFVKKPNRSPMVCGAYED